MEEKENSNEIKEEAKATINDVKETMKKVNVKDDAKETSGFISSMMKDPLAKLKEIADDKSNRNLKVAIILLTIWTIVMFIKSIASSAWRLSIGNSLLNVIKAILAPIISIITLSLITYFMQKDNKKSLTTIITAITISQLPLISAYVISLLTLFSASIYKLTNPIIYFAQVLEIILTYFALKDIIDEESNSKFIKKFAGIEAIYFVVLIVISFLEISMYLI